LLLQASNQSAMLQQQVTRFPREGSKALDINAPAAAAPATAIAQAVAVAAIVHSLFGWV
jgi:hypothetical protein